MVSRVAPQIAYSVVAAVAGTVQRTWASRTIVITGSVSLVEGDRIVTVRAVSTMSLIEIWVPPWPRTMTPASGSLKPPGPGCTGPGLATILTGVPAFAAQPTWNGPWYAQLPAINRATAAAKAAATRSGTVASRPYQRRCASASPTATTHAATTPISHGACASEPVPNPWTTASGQEAYAAQ